ncbi:dolichol kinase [Trichoplusia ni]|uniref:dolichol kinase n=1 Tax=Trichoplusia ni TaxID=7111 RepID=A0A7E5WKZ4_TRINI|nr:dolichol kinase [Trichoplusia ni]
MEKRRHTFIQNLQNKLDVRILRILLSVDQQITNNLKDGEIATRPALSNGLWCSMLLPTVLILYSLQYEVSELYKLLAFISVGLLSYSLLFVVFVSVSCLVLKENIYGGCTASSLTAALLLFIFLDRGLIFSVTLSMAAVFSYSQLLRMSLMKFPKTFTIGEAMIVTQSIILSAVMVATKLVLNNGDVEDEELQFIYSVIFTILSSVGIIVTALCLLDENQRNLSVLSYILSVAGTYALMILHVNIGVDCILKLVGYIFLDYNRVRLFTFWLALALVAAFVILIRTQLAVKASTVTRKSFHVLASIVFLSGIIYNIRLMTLAAGFGFGLMIFVEALRKADIPPISPALQAAFDVYSDHKDVGYFAMTPMYLYVGLACPLVLVPIHDGYELELLAGVLSIGIGDTAASWFGSKYGFNKWADGHKSLQGTAFNVFSQIAAVYALDMFGLLKLNYSLLRVGITATISGLVEAKTDQVDNLVLPLVSLIAFQTTSILC